MKYLRTILTGLALLSSPAFAAWEATFVDNFDGNSLSHKWVRGQENLDRQLQTYLDEGIEVHNGKLSLKIINRPYGDRPYIAGAVTTQGIFAQQYGYYEARVKMAGGDGLWPAFWLMPVTGHWTSEIDIFEYIGDSNSVHHAFHYHWRAQNQNGATTKGFARSLAQEFNTYGLRWTAGKLEYFINGKLVHHISNPTLVAKADKPMFVMLNTALASQHTGWIKPVDESTQFPQGMEIDYVRVYKETPNGTYASIPSHTSHVPNTVNKPYDNVAVSVESTNPANATPSINRDKTPIRDTLRLTAHAAAEGRLWISLHEATSFDPNGRYSSEKKKLLEIPFKFSRAGETREISYDFSDVPVKAPGLYHVDIVVRDREAAHSNRAAARYKSFQYLGSAARDAENFDAFIREATVSGDDAFLTLDVQAQLQEAMLTPFIKLHYEVREGNAGKVVHSGSHQVNHQHIGLTKIRHRINANLNKSANYSLHVRVSDATDSASSKTLTADVSFQAPPAKLSLSIE